VRDARSRSLSISTQCGVAVTERGSDRDMRPTLG
jgi:hypothetical protein